MGLAPHACPLYGEFTASDRAIFYRRSFWPRERSPHDYFVAWVRAKGHLVLSCIEDVGIFILIASSTYLQPPSFQADGPSRFWYLLIASARAILNKPLSVQKMLANVSSFWNIQPDLGLFETAAPDFNCSIFLRYDTEECLSCLSFRFCRYLSLV